MALSSEAMRRATAHGGRARTGTLRARARISLRARSRGWTSWRCAAWRCAAPLRAQALAGALAGALAFWGLVLAGCDRPDPSPPGDDGRAAAEPSSPSPSAADADADSHEVASPAEPERAAKRPEPPKLPTPADAGSCPETDATHVGILVSPSTVVAGEPFVALAATLEDESPLAMRLQDPEGTALDAEITHRPGVPAAAIARLRAPSGGSSMKVVVGREGEGLACLTVKVHARASSRPRPARADAVWPVTRGWDAGEEALFSAWVRELFHAPRGDDLAWSALHEVTSDASRNLLHDHYGWSEDDPNPRTGLHLKPDCADAPYFLRAYFAWKRELPFGFRRCSRGSAGKAPRCGELRGVLGPPENPPDTSKPGELGAVQRYFRRTLAWGVHTGNGRTAFGDDDTDFYPLELTRRGLRPGTIYADPYGHIFVVVELMDAEGDEPGVLYAIDGQPDSSITRKRFWEGNFLWNADPALGGSGFKAFRPLVVEKTDSGGRLVALGDAAIAKRPGYGDASDAQSKLDAAAFYDHMDGLITPGVRDPVLAQREAIVALHEAAKVRVTSVNNGEENYAKSGATIPMPTGHAIFETTGAWENFSTPARDLRILIAIDVATGFADKVARNPEAWGAGTGDGALKKLRETLKAARDEMLADPALVIEYTRSDGSTWKLPIAELIERAAALEVAYNPNDCPEVRWGAPEGSKEAETCRRRAPTEQRRKMKAYREWFHDRRRPPRGDPGPPVE